MQWYEIQIHLPSSLLDSTYNFLWPYINGISVEKQEEGFLIKAFLFSPYPSNLMKKLKSFLHIQSKQYQASYTTSVKPSELSRLNELIIVPSPTGHIPPFGIHIFLSRGRAFGVGSHPCTLYCLKALKNLFHNEQGSVLDAGTGTGILAIAAAKLGWKNITAVEISNEAILEAQENIRLNKAENSIRLLHCSVTETSGLYDLVLANLYSPLLIEIAPSLVEKLQSKGWLVLGGMTVPHDELVISCFTHYGLNACARYHDEEWSVAVLQMH